MIEKSIEARLKELQLPVIKELFRPYAERALQENLKFEEYLEILVEQEYEARKEKRKQRRLEESKMPLSKRLENFDMKRMPLKLQRQMKILIEGDFLRSRENVLIFGNPGSGKTHFLCALGRELICKHDLRLLFFSSGRLLQELLAAKRNFALPKMFKKLLAYDGLIIDDIGYVQQDKEEAEVLFSLISECYEKVSILLTSNLPFSQWEKIFKDPMMTVATIDRLIHHSIVMDMNLPSYRVEKSKEKIKEKEAV